MLHIKDTLIAQSKENANKAKFYRHNQKSFLKYFDSAAQYEAMIVAGSFVKMERIIKDKTEFDFEVWVRDYLQADRLKEFKI